ncbi:MAG: GntR family transcriptional regulator [Tissierellia bacterium]|nr:GntR family transcriptional regulator [Tissierellia bacterium]
MQFNENTPIYLQIVRAIKEKIALGELASGDKFPSVRDIASEFRVNPNTVSRSTQILEQEGIIYSKRGIGSFIVEDDKMIGDMRNQMAKDHCQSFIKNMDRLGFSRQEALEILTEVYDGKH